MQHNNCISSPIFYDLQLSTSFQAYLLLCCKEPLRKARGEAVIPAQTLQCLSMLPLDSHHATRSRCWTSFIFKIFFYLFSCSAKEPSEVFANQRTQGWLIANRGPVRIITPLMRIIADVWNVVSLMKQIDLVAIGDYIFNEAIRSRTRQGSVNFGSGD